MNEKVLKLVLTGLCVVLLAHVTTAQITSPFNSSVEGWTAPNSVGNSIVFIGGGGNPNGFARAVPDFVPAAIVPPFPVYFYFEAPTSYHGNFSSYINGNITVDLQQAILTTPVVRAEVVISNGGTTLYYFPTTPFNPPATPSWTTYNIPLSSASNAWKTANSDTGPAATQLQIQAVLGNITYLGVRGRFNIVLSPGATGIDNVVMQPPITITLQPLAQSVCNGATAVLNMSATGNNNLTYQWQIFNVSTGGYNNVSNGAIYSSVTTNSLNINTTGMMGAGTYRCRISGTNTSDVFTNAVVVTVNPNPSPPGTTGNSSCGSSAVSLNASGGTAGQYRWYTVSSGGTAIAGQTNSAYTTPVLTSSTTYYVSINNGTCESSRTAVTATINPLPVAATATGSSTCGSSAINLNATGGAAGQYRWYTVASGGTAIVGQTNSTYTTPVLTSTTTYYVSINNGTCESNRTAVIGTINTIPTAPTTTGNAACGSSTITLSASGGTAGQYRWYDVASGGTAIATEINSTYTTPILNTTSIYYASINDGTCESNRTAVTAIINSIPIAPTTTGASSCVAAAVTLSAAGGTNGQYVWYDLPSGGTALVGQVNSTFTTPTLVSTTTYYVSINDGVCESTRTPVTATIGGSVCSNSAPTITSSSTSTTIAGIASIDLNALINDIDDNLDPASIKIIIQPSSGASAVIANGILNINYFGVSFAGEDKLTIEACDIFSVCTQQEFTILVEGDVTAFNGISPNNDLFNDKWIIQNIETLPDARENKVTIYNRWGDSVFEIENYDNNTRAFIGINKNGDEVSSGVYFYKIDFKGGRKALTGYLTVKK